MKYLNLFENFNRNDFIDNLAMKYKNILHINSIKPLNDQYSLGKVYLTDKGDLIKITESDSEYKISKKLIKVPHQNFPIIYNAMSIGNDRYGIHKEYIDELPIKYKKMFFKLEKVIDKILKDEYLDYDKSSLFSHKILDTLEVSYFYDYLCGEYPQLVDMYNDFVSIISYTKKLVNNNAIDIHIDNLGIKNGKIILFDY